MMAATGQGMRGSLMGDIVLAARRAVDGGPLRQGRLELDALISGRWSLDQINEAIADTSAGKARRNVIVF
jgi:S-(hydroxymethyl)glutathione dehydrogenase/alcohol dehydrogenase